METKTENMNELEQMRRQLDILKRKLDKQEIINEQVIRSSMKSKMSWIDKYRWISLLAVPFVALCFLPMAMDMEAWGLYFFTILMTAVSVIADFIISRMPEQMFMNCSMLDLTDKLLKMKRYRRIQLFIGIVFIVLWLAWLFYDLYSYGYAGQDDPDMKKYWIVFMVSVGIGALIGGIIGFFIFSKMQRTNDKIISQIEELRREQESDLL